MRVFGGFDGLNAVRAKRVYAESQGDIAPLGTVKPESPDDEVLPPPDRIPANRSCNNAAGLRKPGAEAQVASSYHGPHFPAGRERCTESRRLERQRYGLCPDIFVDEAVNGQRTIGRRNVQVGAARHGGEQKAEDGKNGFRQRFLLQHSETWIYILPSWCDSIRRFRCRYILSYGMVSAPVFRKPDRWPEKHACPPQIIGPL